MVCVGAAAGMCVRVSTPLEDRACSPGRRQRRWTRCVGQFLHAGPPSCRGNGARGVCAAPLASAVGHAADLVLRSLDGARVLRPLRVGPPRGGSHRRAVVGRDALRSVVPGRVFGRVPPSRVPVRCCGVFHIVSVEWPYFRSEALQLAPMCSCAGGCLPLHPVLSLLGHALSQPALGYCPEVA